MLRCRLLTEHAGNLRSQSRTRDLFSASMGQEAIATGCVIDLRPQDTIALAPHDSIAGMIKRINSQMHCLSLETYDDLVKHADALN